MNEGNMPKRISISLSAETAMALEKLAKEQGVTQNEIIRRAIATEAYFHEQKKEGSKVLLQRSNGKIAEVIFR